MNAGLSRFEPAWLTDIGAGFSDRLAKPAKNLAIWLPAVLIVGLGAWMLFSGDSGKTTEHRTVGRTALLTAAPAQPMQSFEKSPVRDVTQFNPVAQPSDAASSDAVPLDRLKISSQIIRRGGLGSKALITFTLRNDNDFAVKDIGLLCSFSRMDGSPVTERRQTIHDTVKMKSRKTFARVHVGFINITANQAKCSLLSAGRV